MKLTRTGIQRTRPVIQRAHMCVSERERVCVLLMAVCVNACESERSGAGLWELQVSSCNNILGQRNIQC